MNFDISQENRFDGSIKTLRYIVTRWVPHLTEQSLRYLAKVTIDSGTQNAVSQKNNLHSVLQKNFDISQDNHVQRVVKTNFDISQENHFDRSIKTLRYIVTRSVPHLTEQSLRYLAKVTVDSGTQTPFLKRIISTAYYRRISISSKRFILRQLFSELSASVKNLSC